MKPNFKFQDQNVLTYYSFFTLNFHNQFHRLLSLMVHLVLHNSIALVMCHLQKWDRIWQPALKLSMSLCHHLQWEIPSGGIKNPPHTRPGLKKIQEMQGNLVSIRFYIWIVHTLFPRIIVLTSWNMLEIIYSCPANSTFYVVHKCCNN